MQKTFIIAATLASLLAFSPNLASAQAKLSGDKQGTEQSGGASGSGGSNGSATQKPDKGTTLGGKSGSSDNSGASTGKN